MLTPLSWLKDYVDIDITPQELEEKLFSCGFEVEELYEVGKDISKVVVGHVLTCEAIPDVPNQPIGRIESQITRNPKDRLQMAVSFDPEVGKHAVTHYTLLENYSYTSLIECRLETGRTHQIRVHMKHLGHPLFNDERYGGNIVLKGTTFSRYRQFIQHSFDTSPRQALHAKTLGFVHPVTGQQMQFDSELPTDMKLLVEGWREYVNSIDK